MTTDPLAEEIVAFWRDAGPKAWWKKSDTFDDEIRRQFGDAFEMARLGKLDHWASTGTGSLALILLLDQFSRNLCRGNDPEAFAQDPHALAIAAAAIAADQDESVADLALRQFFYMPFMHAENLACQNRCIKFIETIDDADSLRAAHEHHDIIAKFGRFPHRNTCLGRETTAEEQAFLDGGGFAG